MSGEVQEAMRIVSQQRFGGPEVLDAVQAPVPIPGRGEVLLRLGATAVNPVDCKLRTGRVRFLGDPPFTLGFDISGTIVETGAGVDGMHPDDHVFGMIHSRTGTYSEFVIARADALASRPPGVDHVVAAALPTAALTARQAVDAADPKPGETVLVHAAAGGVGHFAVQFAEQRGAHVIGTARTSNHRFLSELGAAEVIDYTTTDFTAAIGPVDVVLDLVGGAYGQRSLRVLPDNGRYLTVQESDAEGDPRYRRITGRPSPALLADIGTSVAEGRVRVHVDRALPLDEVRESHRLSETGRVRGKLVLTPWRDRQVS
ncbi:NADP-dependent oxidoreductase [Nocardia carnea]|uniref:NADP-dependent oxidoreductase n=1 Tax=Nocardia carnea TaxID=37328 RepID=UPI002456FB0B|nr:NADP-dependent oxidoreductase [Nocardia carnea]